MKMWGSLFKCLRLPQQSIKQVHRSQSHEADPGQQIPFFVCSAQYLSQYMHEKNEKVLPSIPASFQSSVVTEVTLINV